MHPDSIHSDFGALQIIYLLTYFSLHHLVQFSAVGVLLIHIRDNGTITFYIRLQVSRMYTFAVPFKNVH